MSPPKISSWPVNFTLDQFRSDTAWTKNSDSTVEKFQPNLQDFGCLEVLELVGCKKLKRAPNFSGPCSLKTLSLYGCSLLENVQDQSGLLRLHEFYLYEYSNLIELRGVESLVNLERIDLHGCYHSEQ
ncbi:PREDICTED: putative adenylate cyclase regulatory protein [Ipomoea nil]|uniref:putative adenylate cyclase regulatory protein n=1 Tax=Ipomoea nil TaxID=35883 RepID=UPI0009012098|nr:PREDICTED: putative adenylate cyclase regulatory protein [Ipomoea nil]